MRWVIALLLSATTAMAEGEKPGKFDYWVLALSWSPNWCTLEGDARDAPQCDQNEADKHRHTHTQTLHNSAHHGAEAVKRKDFASTSPNPAPTGPPRRLAGRARR